MRYTYKQPHTALILLFVLTILLTPTARAQTATDGVERWGTYEVTLKGPVEGNPFIDVNLSAEFTHDEKTIGVGCYVGHGETYVHPNDILWWSKGGVLYGESPARIAFVRKLVEDGSPVGLDPVVRIVGMGRVCRGQEGRQLLLDLLWRSSAG